MGHTQRFLCIDGTFLEFVCEGKDWEKLTKAIHPSAYEWLYAKMQLLAAAACQSSHHNSSNSNILGLIFENPNFKSLTGEVQTISRHTRAVLPIKYKTSINHLFNIYFSFLYDRKI